MSGKGCQLLVSPRNVSPSFSAIRGHQSQSVRMSSPQRANAGRCSGMGKVKKRLDHSFASRKQGGSHVVLPTLSLRRQVLTNGKHLNVQGQSSHQPAPAHHNPATTEAIRTGSSNNNFKGKRLKHQISLVGVSYMCQISIFRAVY